MTKEQLNKANDIRREIEYATAELKSAEENLNTFIEQINGGVEVEAEIWEIDEEKVYSRFLSDEFRAFLESLVQSRNNRITELEKEFEQL